MGAMGGGWTNLVHHQRTITSSGGYITINNAEGTVVCAQSIGYYSNTPMVQFNTLIDGVYMLGTNVPSYGDGMKIIQEGDTVNLPIASGANISFTVHYYVAE